jgi:hypothetical protein
MPTTIRWLLLAVIVLSSRHIATSLLKEHNNEMLLHSLAGEPPLNNPPLVNTKASNAVPALRITKSAVVTLQPEKLVSTPSELTNNTVSVAYVISVTSCGITVFDGAAVLAASIAATQQPGYKLIALLYDESALQCRKGFEVLGYEVMAKGIPFDVNKMKRDTKLKVIRGGCCGATEYLKLYAYLLLDFEVVVHLDIDVILLKSLDPLIDVILKGSNSTHSIRTIPRDQVIPRTVDFLFVREYNTYSMIEPTNRIKFGVQGAFFLLRPSQERFDDLIRVLLTTTYTSKLGWNLMGFGGYWGSAQIQGFLSYYYYALDNLASAVELDPCRYNTLGFDKRYLVEPNLTHLCRTGEATCEDCSATPFDEIYVAHLSLCKKPWWCPLLDRKKLPLCTQFYSKWFEFRRQIDQQLFGRDLSGDSANNKYSQLSLGYCTGEGKSAYRSIASERSALFLTNSTEAQT